MEVLYSRTKSSTYLRFGGKRVQVEPVLADCIYFVEGTQFASDNDLALELNGKFYKVLAKSSLPVAGCVKTDIGFVGLCSIANVSRTYKSAIGASTLIGIAIGVLAFIAVDFMKPQQGDVMSASSDSEPKYVAITHQIAEKVRGSGANAFIDTEDSTATDEDSEERERLPKPTNIDTSVQEAALAKEIIRTLENVPLNVPSGIFTVNQPLFIIRNTTGEKIKVTVEAEDTVVWTSFIAKDSLEYFNVYDKLLMGANFLNICIEGENVEENYSVGVWLK